MKRGREPGRVKVFQCEKGKPYPKEEDFVNLPVWSRGASPWSNLSPFFLKTDDGTIFENEWQRYKVYRKIDAQNQSYCDWTYPETVHYDASDTFKEEEWKKWSEKLKHHKKAVRHPNGRAIPVFAFYNNERLGVVEARKKIYIPMLQKIYRKHPDYHKILTMLQEGKNVILIEPDGPPMADALDVDIDLLTKLQDVTTRKEFWKTIEKEYYDQDKYFPYGHGYVLALTLLQDLQK
jgi:hypothetical protein